MALTSYAEQLLAKQSQNRAAGPDWIGSAEAARLSGYSPRQIRRLCDEGFFIEGEDWKQRPSKPGRNHAGRIRIRRAALKKLDGSGD